MNKMVKKAGGAWRLTVMVGVFLLAVGLVLFLIFFPFAECRKKEWWEDVSKINVEFSDPLATPQSITVNMKEEHSNLTFIYAYDGEEHYPEARILVDGEEYGFVLRDGKQMYMELEEIYSPIPWIKFPGKYSISYDLYKTNEVKEEFSGKDFLLGFNIYIEIS